MERQEYEQMIKEMQEKCVPAYSYMKSICELMPPSMQCHLKAYADTMSYEYKLRNAKSAKPYLTWSLGPDRLSRWVPDNVSYLATICYWRGEFAFYPYQERSIRILRRTPEGWGMQEETLIDELISLAKYASECNIYSLLGHITDTFLKIPYGLKKLIQENVYSSLNKDVQFLFMKSLIWLNIARAKEHIEKDYVKHLIGLRDEMREIETDLESTKSIAKSKVLRAIRERCKRLELRMENISPKGW